VNSISPTTGDKTAQSKHPQLGTRSSINPRNSVRGKLVGIILLTTAIVLFLSGGAMLLHDLSVYRTSWASDIATEAGILALSTGPALAFDDHETAQRNLAALQARPAVLAAALYTPDRKLYAQYVKDGEAAPEPLRSDSTLGIVIAGERVEVTQQIEHNKELLGTLYLRARYDVTGRIKAYLGIFALITAASLAAALLLSAALQRVITVPLEAITRIARQVVDRGDYSLRVTKTTEDEIGIVVQAFNRMLDEVEGRTQALEQSNESLRTEVKVRQAAEEALRDADRRKDEFLATLAHELRNPLAPIRHATRILEAPTANDAQRQWGREVIARQVEHMALLLDDLLDVSRITRGRLDLKKEYVSLGKLVATAVETARPLIDAKQHTLAVNLPDEPVELNVDPLRIAQALSNLLTNAAKYTDPGGHIGVVANVSRSGLQIEVRDTGIGIEPAAMPRIFEMFSQIESALERSQGGLGIGLALVKGLIQLHGGTVEVSSAGGGQGSTFTIHLPYGCLVQALPAPHTAAVTESPAGPRCKVLIADDNKDAADSLMMLLNVSGYDVRVAYSGPQALEIARTYQPDAFVLDIGMPEMTGYELAIAIRNETWGVKALLIALTGWGQQEDKNRAHSAGFDQHFTKPVNAQAIEAVLAEFAENRAASA
jgi:signal transduction histidine kinase/ActR/RegA family two-component response regulator